MTTNNKPSNLLHNPRFLAILCLALIIASLAVSSLSYLTSLKNQNGQESLELKYRDLDMEYAGLQSNFNNLQSNYTNLSSNLTQLQSAYADLKANLIQIQQNYVNNQSFSELQQIASLIQTQLTDIESRLNTSESKQDLLKLQQELFNSQLSALKTNYTSFLSQYQALGTAAPFSYLIFSDAAGKYLAENGTTQALDYSGYSGSQVAQNCIDALSNSGGKIVFAGRIKLEKPLSIETNTSGLLELSGFGPSTQLICNNGSDCIEVIGSKAFGSGGDYHVSIDNLVLTSEFSPEGKLMNNGIYVKNWFNINIENVMIFYAENAGVLIANSANVHLNNVYVEGCAGTEYGGTKALTGTGFWLQGSKDCYLSQCYSDTNEIGFLFDSDNQTNNDGRNVFLTQCEATLCDKTGVSVANTAGIVISSLLVEGSGEDGVMIVDSFQSTIISSIVSGNGGNGIVVTTESANMSQAQISIQECTLIGNNKNGIGIWAKNAEKISQIKIEGCTVANSGTGVHGNSNQPNTWDGINISNDASSGGKCMYITIANCFVGNEAGLSLTQKYGVRSLQDSDFVQVLNCNFFGNIAGNYTLVGGNNVVKDNVND